jgi:hypothetical protein
MSVQEIIEEAQQLSIAERMEILKVLTRSIQDELIPHEKENSPFSADSLAGILKPESGSIPTDEEIKTMYVDYLIEKYK